MAIPRILKNYNLFVQGLGMAGLVDEIELPKITVKVEEHRAGGMDGVAGIDMGIEKMETSFTLAEHNPLVFSQFGLISGRAVQLIFRAAAVDDREVQPYMVAVTGMYTELDSGTLKAGDKTPLKATIICRYFRLEINGQPLIEIDVENMVRSINGVDQMTAIRAALAM
jgi:P2 family phage contractile tail tube protein